MALLSLQRDGVKSPLSHQNQAISMPNIKQKSKGNILCATQQKLAYLVRPPPTTFVYSASKELSSPVHRSCRGRTCGANLRHIVQIIFHDTNVIWVISCHIVVIEQKLAKFLIAQQSLHP